MTTAQQISEVFGNDRSRFYIGRKQIHEFCEDDFGGTLTDDSGEGWDSAGINDRFTPNASKSRRSFSSRQQIRQCYNEPRSTKGAPMSLQKWDAVLFAGSVYIIVETGQMTCYGIGQGGDLRPFDSVATTALSPSKLKRLGLMRENLRVVSRASEFLKVQKDA